MLILDKDLFTILIGIKKGNAILWKEAYYGH
jgi:hypothetical protein